MGRNKKDVFKNQMKTVQNIADRIQALIDKHRNLNGKILKDGKVNMKLLGVLFRAVVDPNNPTLYEEGFHGKGGIKDGIRECDYKFCKTNPDWIEASRKHGLSFSSTTEHAVATIEFLGGFQKKGTKIECAYWIFEDSEWIPDGMEFIQDPKKDAHYLLAVVEPMLVSDLVSKLESIAIRMAVMNDLPLGAYKNA